MLESKLSFPVVDYVFGYQNRASQTYNTIYEIGRLPEKLETTHLEYLTNLVLFSILARRLIAPETDIVIPQWLTDDFGEEGYDSEMFDNTVSFLEMAASSVGEVDLRNVAQNLYRGLILDPQGDIFRLVVNHKFPIPNQAFSGDRTQFRTLQSFLSQGVLTLEDTLAAEEKIKKRVYTIPTFEDVSVLEIVNHTKLVQLAGFEDINHFYSLVYGEDLGKYRCLAEAVSSVMQSKYPQILQAMSSTARGSDDISDLSYFQLLSLPPFTLEYDPYQDKSGEIDISKPKNGEEREKNNIYTYIRFILEKSGELDEDEMIEFIRLIHFDTVGHPRWFPRFDERTNELSSLEVRSYLTYYGFYALLEEIGHALVRFKLLQKGVKEAFAASDEEQATAFQGKVMPYYLEALKATFDFARDLPENYGDLIRKIFKVKRLFFLAHKAVQVGLELDYYQQIGELVRNDGDRLITSFDSCIEEKRWGKSKAASSLRQEAKVQYARVFGIPEEKTPEWRMLGFVADQYPEWITGHYFRDMLSEQIECGWDQLDVSQVKEKLSSILDQYLSSLSPQGQK